MSTLLFSVLAFSVGVGFGALLAVIFLPGRDPGAEAHEQEHDHFHHPWKP